jgi:hypothetical protein
MLVIFKTLAPIYGLILSASLRSISVYFRKSMNSLLARDGLTMAVPLAGILSR